MCFQVIIRGMNPKSDSSSSINLSNGTELDLGGTTIGETGIVLVLSLLVLSSVERNLSGLHIFVFISNLLFSF